MILSSTDSNVFYRYLRSGPFQLALVVTLLLSIFVFQVKKLSVPSEERNCSSEEKKMMVAALTWSLFVVIVFCSLQRFVKEDQVAGFMLTSLLVSIVQQIIPLYFIMTLPKLKTFAYGCLTIFKRNKVLPL